MFFTPSTLPTAIIRGNLLGSNDDTTWDAVYAEFTVTTWTAERQLLPAGYTPNTKQYLFYRLIARQIQGVTTGGHGATEKLNIGTLRFTYNQNVAFIDSVLCIGDPVGGNVPAANCILDINGATNMQGSVNILGNVGVGVTDTTTYKLNVGGTLNTSGIVTTTANKIGILGGSPTLYLRHSNTGLRSAMIHCNGNILYFLGGAYNSDITNDNWSYAANNRWPLEIILSNNDASFGGNIFANSGHIYAANYIYSSGFIQGAGSANSWRITANDGWIRLRDPGESTHKDFAAGRLYAHNELDVQGTTTLNNLLNVNSQILAYYSVSRTNTDYLCVQGNTSFEGQYYQNWIRIAYLSFTEFHRCYTNDILYNTENSCEFKKNYMGRVVIATGKIKTDSTDNNEESGPYTDNIKPEWISRENKEGISIEDAIPVVQLSRKKKDKRVFGVLGEPTRSTNNKDRLIVNNVGEGAICVANTNGNIENGDYIQSSDLLGYGEKQDDDLLHNYTIAKSTIDCNFELDSPYYQCHEIENGVRVAFIACTYHCG
jgi:hypothetical protein